MGKLGDAGQLNGLMRQPIDFNAGQMLELAEQIHPEPDDPDDLPEGVYERYAQFYSNPELYAGNFDWIGLLHPSISRCVSYLGKPDITQIELNTVQLALRMLASSLGQSELYSHYWRQHSSEYIERVDGLISQMDSEAQMSVAHTLLTVVIPAYNEKHVEKTVQAIVGSLYAEDLEMVEIVVYHNFKCDAESVDSEVIESLRRAKQLFPKLRIIEEQVSPDNDISMAKKVALDTVLRLKSDEDFLSAILCLDADITDIQMGAIYSSRRFVQKFDGPSFVSCNYEVNKDITKRYPVLALYFQLASAIQKFVSEMSGIQQYPNIIGGYALANPKTWLLCGGIIPVHNYFEDTNLTNQLTACNGILGHEIGRSKARWPVGNVSKGFKIGADMTREIEILLTTSNESPYSRWKPLEPGRQKQLSQKERIDVYNLHGEGPFFSRRIKDKEIEFVISEIVKREIPFYLEMFPELSYEKIGVLFANAILKYLVANNVVTKSRAEDICLRKGLIPISQVPVAVNKTYGARIGRNGRYR